MKKRMISRTVAGFLVVWLVFAGVLSALLASRAKQTFYEGLRAAVPELAPYLQDISAHNDSETLSRSLLNTCQWWPNLRAGAIYKQDMYASPIAQTEFAFYVGISEQETGRTFVTFSPLDCLTEEQYTALTGTMQAEDELFRAAYKKIRGRKSGF